MIRSHLTAFGVGAGLALLGIGAVSVIAPRIADPSKLSDGVHVINIGDGDRGSFRLKDASTEIEASWKGDFEFAADGRSLSSLDGTLEVESGRGAEKRKVVFSRAAGSVTATIYADRKPLEAGAETAAVAGDILQQFARSSSIKAESRVRALVAAGGKDAAIEEIGNLLGGHAVGAYVAALVKAAELSSTDVAALADRAAATDSDYSKRKAVTALLGVRDLDDAAMARIMRAANSIGGDHELRLIIEELAELPFDQRRFEAVTALIGDIDGEHEVRLAVSSLLGSRQISDDAAARALAAAAAAIDGGYELRLAVEAASERLRNDAVAAAAIDAIGKIGEAHELRLAIESVAKGLGTTPTPWIALAGTATLVDSDFERRLAIEGIASRAPDNDDIAAALRKAAEGIASEHERTLALESLD